MKKSVIKKFQSIVGEKDAYLEKKKLESFRIDGLIPEIALFPQSVEQVSEIMMLASKESLRVMPVGAGTKTALGNKPQRVDIVVSTNNLNQIVEHAASDLVATTQTGVSLKNLQAHLNKQNQFLALDPPRVEKGATIGGVIATNDSGPERLRYGTLREFLIGIKVVQADGKVFKGGSKVVKNVAGYDLPKLYVGSLGTLGIIVEATFRLYPVPEYSETCLASFSSLSDCHDTVMTLLSSDLVLTSLEVLNPELTALLSRNNLDLEQGNYTLVIGIKNVQKAVKDQISNVKAICDQKSSKGSIINGEGELSFWEDIRNFPWKFAENERIICKASTLVTDVPKLLDNISTLSRDNSINAYVSVRAGNGVSAIAFEGEESNLLNSLQALSSFVSLLGGHLIVQEASSGIKSEIDVWGDIGSGKQVMKKIKNNFDPDNILNPGRYI